MTGVRLRRFYVSRRVVYAYSGAIWADSEGLGSFWRYALVYGASGAIMGHLCPSCCRVTGGRFWRCVRPFVLEV